MSKRHNNTGRSNKEPRHVRIYESLMRTEAWKSLGCIERSAYLEFARRYNGSNNGRIGCSMRQLAEALHVGKSTAKRATDTLQERVFIVITQMGSFDWKVNVGGELKHHATTWRLTEHSCDVTNAMASRDFENWAARKIAGS